MSDASWLTLVFLFLLLFAGVWVGFALIAAAVVGLWWLGRDPIAGIAHAFWSMGANWTITALPLFIWMGEILARTHVAARLFTALAPLMQRLPGGLLHINVAGCTLFAAVSGSSAATCATIGRITLPELKRFGYPERMSIGTLAGASTLGLLIPPSIVMIVYGVAADVSISQLFLAGVVPGLLVALLFSGWIAGWALFRESSAGVGVTATVNGAGERPLKMGEALAAIVPFFALIVLVLGSIYSGVATVTEAAALGVLGSLFLAWREEALSWQTLWETITAAVRLYGMIAFILFASAYLTLAMGYLGLPRRLAEWIVAQGLTRETMLVAVALLFLLLGCVLDGISLILITAAVLLPALAQIGVDLLWFGVFAVILIEAAQITPPVGFNLFVLQGMTGKPMGEIVRAALPSLIVLLIASTLLLRWPEVALWLPRVWGGGGIG